MSIVSAKDAMYLAKESTINKVSELIRNAYARGEYSCHVRKQFLPEELRLKLQKELGYKVTMSGNTYKISWRVDDVE